MNREADVVSAPPGRARWFRRVVVVVVLAAGLIGLRLTVLRPKPVPVTVFRVATGLVEETVTNSRSGSVKSRRRATLSPETGGRVEEILARAGQRVRRGDLLLRLFDDDARAQLDLQQRALEAARANENEACEAMALSGREQVRQEELIRQGISSPQLLDQIRSRHDAATSACQAARARTNQAAAALDVARTTLARTRLHAPFDGVVAELDAEVGEWITPSPPGIPIPAVVELIDPTAIYVSAPLDEVDVARVHEGLPVRVTMDARPGQSFMGRLTRIAPYVMDQLEQNRTFEVEVTLDDAELAKQLLPGTSADVEVILGSKANVLRIPSYGLMAGRSVLIVRDDRLEEIPVETGLRNWAFVEITRGVVAGDAVVVSLDRPEVQAGAKVRIESETEK